MHENSGNSVIYYAHYTEGGVNKTGLTVTITVYEVIRDGTKTEVVTDGACTEIGDGLYRYLLASGTVDAAAEYVAVFHTATDTVDTQDIPAIWVIDRAGTEKLDNGITLADDAITASKFDESTAYPLKSADTGSTQVARVGADSDTLKTLSDEIAAVKAETALIVADTGTDGVVVASGQTVATVTNLTNLPTMPANWVTSSGLKADAVTEIQSGLALEATLTAIKAKTDNLPDDPADDSDIDAQLAAIKAETAAILDDTGTTLDTKINTIDGIVDDIKLKTDLIPASPAEAGEYTTAIAALQTDLDNPDQYKADVSALATTAHVQEVEDKVDIVDGIADAILDDTGTSGVLLSTSALGSIFDDEVIIGTYTFSDLLKIMAAALAGKLSGGGSTTLKFEGVDGASDVIVTTVDANKNRTNVVITV